MWLPFRIQQAFEALQRDAAMDLRLQAIACQEARGSVQGLGAACLGHRLPSGHPELQKRAHDTRQMPRIGSSDRRAPRCRARRGSVARL